MSGVCGGTYKTRVAIQARHCSQNLRSPGAAGVSGSAARVEGAAFHQSEQVKILGRSNRTYFHLPREPWAHLIAVPAWPRVVKSRGCGSTEVYDAICIANKGS
jgi:hypothetical protein